LNFIYSNSVDFLFVGILFTLSLSIFCAFLAAIDTGILIKCYRVDTGDLMFSNFNSVHFSVFLWLFFHPSRIVGGLT